MTKQYSAACERNREPILGVLREQFAERKRVLEIGSGSGQHAVHFAKAMPWLRWQASDRVENLASIEAWLDEAALPNTPPPIQFNVNIKPWPDGKYDAVFSANTLHIMSWAEVERMFAAIDALLDTNASVVVYGPFNQGGGFTSASNAAFDASLKVLDPHMGLRDTGAVNRLAHASGLRLIADVPLPANNRCLVWRRERLSNA